MYFDKNKNVIPTQSGIIQVGEANTLGQLAQSGIVARSDGFFYTYVTNRSEGAVYFDNLAIKHWAPMVRLTYDYYPYGLTWENPKLPTDPNAVHDHAYQGKEFQFAEFTTGHGLALYDFHARMYDPCTARWLVPDPAAQFANPYLAMGNSPILQIDPDGEFIVTAIVVGAIVGAAIGTTAGMIKAHNEGYTMHDKQFWGHAAAGFAIGAVVGAAAGAAWEYGILTVGVRPNAKMSSDQRGFGLDFTNGIGMALFLSAFMLGVHIIPKILGELVVGRLDLVRMRH
jgi:RHS repeat-associated protein